jgi:hypothetical protein
LQMFGAQPPEEFVCGDFAFHPDTGYGKILKPLTVFCQNKTEF